MVIVHQNLMDFCWKTNKMFHFKWNMKKQSIIFYHVFATKSPKMTIFPFSSELDFVKLIKG